MVTNGKTTALTDHDLEVGRVRRQPSLRPVTVAIPRKLGERDAIRTHAAKSWVSALVSASGARRVITYRVNVIIEYAAG